MVLTANYFKGNFKLLMVKSKLFINSEAKPIILITTNKILNYSSKKNKSNDSILKELKKSKLNSNVEFCLLCVR
jgi:hypothetical protein